MQLHQELHSHSMEAYSCAMAASAASAASSAASSSAAAAVAAAVAAAELQQNIRKFKCEPEEPEGGAGSALDELNKMDDCLVSKSMGHKLKYGKYSPADDGCLYNKPHPATVILNHPIPWDSNFFFFFFFFLKNISNRMLLN